MSSNRAARAEDWAQWLGPTHDGLSTETGWLKAWPEAGPPVLFRRPVGEGYSAVSVARGKLILFHREKDEMVVECLGALDGKTLWRHAYPTDYSDAYGYSGGPRAQPVVSVGEGGAGRVYTLCSKGILTALELEGGKKVWDRDLQGELKLEPNFFGVGAAPLLDGGRLYLNLGGTQPGSGVALSVDAGTGEIRWRAPTDGGSYAVARLAEIDGLRHLFVFHRGGLSNLDPADGRERWKFPWMSRTYESVNAATPLVIGDLLFFSATYLTGGVCLRVKKDGFDIVWQDDLRTREKILETHWSTAIAREGYLYGFSGRHESSSDLRCVELKTGKVLWRWPSVLGRGSLLHADGHMIALGERGDLQLLKLGPGGHSVVAAVKGVLKYPAWTPPVLSGGLLYLRDEHQLVCFDLRSKP